MSLGRATGPRLVVIAWQPPPSGAYKFRLDLLRLPSSVAPIPHSHAGQLHELSVLAGAGGVARLLPSFRCAHEGKEPCARLAALRPGAQYALIVYAVNRDFVAGGGTVPLCFRVPDSYDM